MLDDEQLLDCAINVIDNSYSPYSHFKVAAAVMTMDGDVFTGVNIENMSYGLSICAERIAIANSVSAGAEQIMAIAIYHDGVDMPFPCGACLQVMSEFNSDMKVTIACYSGVKTFCLKDLLPYNFSAEELQR